MTAGPGRVRPRGRPDRPSLLEVPLSSVLRDHPEALAPLLEAGVPIGTATEHRIAQRPDAERIVELVLEATRWRPS